MSELESNSSSVIGRRVLSQESSLDCDKCNKPVPDHNDASMLDAIAFGIPGTVLFSRKRHLLSTDICQGSPSRAQYLPGEPKDLRGGEYYPEMEPLMRASHELMRARYTDDKLLSDETLEFLMNNIGKGMRLIREDEERKQKEENERQKRIRHTSVKRGVERQPRAPLVRRSPSLSRRGSERFQVFIEDKPRYVLEDELKILKALSEREGKATSYELSEILWGEQRPQYHVANRVASLRRHLKMANGEVFIKGIKGQGYFLDDPEGKIKLPEEPKVKS